MERADIIRPIYGTVVLQPLVLLWCWLTDIPYFTNLGWFTIIATIYLMPVYAYFESHLRPRFEKP